MKTFLSIFFVSITCSINAQFVDLDWAYSLGGRSAGDLGKTVQVDHAGNIYVHGSLLDTIDIDPGPGTFIFRSPLNELGLFIQKLDPAGNMLWAHQLGRDFLGDSTTGDIMHVDDFGNVYISGPFNGTIDLDPGPGTFNLTSTSGKNDIFVLKLDGNGNFLWATRTGGTQEERVGSLISDQKGNLYVTGNFYGLTDFDPGPGTFDMLADPLGDAFIQKLDSSGNFVWAKEIANNNFDGISASAVDRLGNVILTGSFQGTLDIDPGTGLVPLNSTNNTRDIYVLKLDQTGDFVWARSLKSSVNYEKLALVVDAANEIILAGPIRGTIDLDPGPDSMNITANGIGEMFIQKLDQAGNLLWANVIGSTTPGQGYVFPDHVEADLEGNIYAVGGYNGTIDFDPGQGTANTTSSQTHTFIVSYNASGNHLWTRSKGNSSLEVKNFVVDNAKNLLMTGRFFQNFNAHPDSGLFTLTAVNNSRDMFLLKWKQDSCTGLAAIVESIADPACGTPGLVVGSAVGGSGNYTYSWNTIPASTQRFAQVDTPGTYRFVVSDAAGCSNSTQAVVGGPANLRPRDLNINITSNDFRPGRTSSIWVDAYNDGCLPIDGEVVIVLDNFLTFTSAFPAPDSINGQKLIWFFTGLSDTSGHFRARINATVSLQANIGDEVCIESAIVSKGGGNNTKFNNRGYCRDIRNSYDPNDKRVFPEGICEEGFIENDEWLTYTLRFQNTGNAEAIDIFLLDTIDTDLDLNTMRVVGQSHEPMVTELLPNRTLKFRFDNIYLPDSTSDEPNSHGYVIFEILPNQNLPVPTEIRNSTSIYFDFNKPVKTNTVRNTVTDVLPEIDTTFLQVNTCETYVLNRRMYTESGRYTQVLSRDRDCDSVIVLNLNVIPLDTGVTRIGATLTANEGGAHGLDVSYQWVDCNNGNAPIAGATERSFSPEVNGIYAVEVSRGTCMEISACQNVMNVAVDRGFESELSYYPNPSGGSVEIELGRTYLRTEISILNVVGQIIRKEKVGVNQHISLELPEQAGVYFLKLNSDGREAMIKVLKK